MYSQIWNVVIDQSLWTPILHFENVSWWLLGKNSKFKLTHLCALLSFSLDNQVKVLTEKNKELETAQDRNLGIQVKRCP